MDSRTLLRKIDHVSARELLEALTAYRRATLDRAYLQAFGRVADEDRVDAGHRRNAADVAHGTQHVHCFLEVCVANVEDPFGLFRVVAPLGWRVGNDDDRAGARDLIEGACALRDRVEGLSHRQVAQQADRGRGVRKAWSNVTLRFANRASVRYTVRLVAWVPVVSCVPSLTFGSS